MLRTGIIICLLLLALSSANAQRSPSAKTQPQTLDEKVQSALNGFQGKAWIYAKNLDTGKDYALRADEQTRTASTIKLAIMAEAFHQVAQGKLKWDDSIE